MTALQATVRRPGPAATPLRHTEPCMGTVFSLHVVAPGVERTDLFGVLAWLHDMDALFSTYRSDSQVSAINAGRLQVADADPEVREVLAACEELRDATDGYFDVHFGGRRLDPSGYVKGWAIRTASDMLAAAGSTNHCVNGGGDVLCLGRPAPDRYWNVGVTDPHDRDVLLHTVSGPAPLAVATSGPAERGAHIVDPHTRQPVTDVASVTVAARDIVLADVFATAAVAMGARRGAAWLARREDVRGILVGAQ